MQSGNGLTKGLIFTIASGRPIQGVETNILNLDVPFITYNGAMVVLGKSKRYYMSKVVPK